MPRGLIIITAAMLVSCPRAALGAHEVTFSVAQPLAIDGPGPIVAEILYVNYNINRLDPTAELLLTVEPNVIRCDSGPQNRNLAAREGYSLRDQT